MADDYDNEQIRRGLAVLLEDAPLAPDFDDLTTIQARPVETRRPRPFAVAGLSTAAVLATFLVVAVWLGGSVDSPGPVTEVPATPTDTLPRTLPELAPGVFPRVLLEVPEWSIVYVDHSEGETPEGAYGTSTIIFSNQVDEARLSMYSGWHADLRTPVADVEISGSRLTEEPIWDTTAVVVGGTVVPNVDHLDGTEPVEDLDPRAFVNQDQSTFRAMWEANAVVFEFVAHDVDEETFRSLLSSLTQTTEEEWIATLPDEIVTDRVEAVTDYLTDVPLPPGFEVASLAEGHIEHWYQVAAETMSAVTCGWIDSWVDAKETGDTEAAQQAVDAMASSHDWPILGDMLTFGEYSNMVWDYADAMAGDGIVPAGAITTVEASYENAFGCER